MERYRLIKEVGDGTFGNVWRAINRHNGEVVAIKKMKKKYYSLEECMNLREVKSLHRMNHPNIVKLKEVIRENDILYFVFEYLDFNLYQIIKDRSKVFTEAEVRNWCFQIFQALAYMHQRGYFHRDLKPENLLASKGIIKLADFGLAREVSSQSPYTEYVSTRWYRAPEILLQATFYNTAVDMWAMGAIMAELFTLRPLFPGSSEADEIYKICSVIGSPDNNTWPEGLQLAEVMKYEFPQLSIADLSALIPSASVEAIDLIKLLCSWDPTKRPKAAEVLQHPFFQSCFNVPPSLRPRMAHTLSTPPSVVSKVSMDQKVGRRYTTGAPYVLQSTANYSAIKSNSSLRTGAQRKLELNSQDPVISERSMKNNMKQSRYRPLARNNLGTYGEKSCKVSDVPVKVSNVEMASTNASSLANKMGKMSLKPCLQQTGKPPLASMKAGDWHKKTDLVVRSNTNPYGRSYSRTISG